MEQGKVVVLVGFGILRNYDVQLELAGVWRFKSLPISPNPKSSRDSVPVMSFTFPR